MEALPDPRNVPLTLEALPDPRKSRNETSFKLFPTQPTPASYDPTPATPGGAEIHGEDPCAGHSREC